MRIAFQIGVLVVACVAVAGCSRTETFDISVRNDTGDPLTLALTKDGPPFEYTLAAPEELAIQSPRADEQHGYLVLPPGREADVTVKGRFEGQTRGILRVYRGDLQISDMSAIGPASPDRLNLPLRPGANRFVIADAAGRLAVARDVVPSAPPPPPRPPVAPGPAAPSENLPQTP